MNNYSFSEYFIFNTISTIYSIKKFNKKEPYYKKYDSNFF